MLRFFCGLRPARSMVFIAILLPFMGGLRAEDTIHELPSLPADIERRYIVDRDVLIKTPEGVTLSAVLVRDRGATGPQPTALMFTIYNRPQRNFREALHAAAHGYVGVVADARGKRLSREAIRPYETEAKDVNSVIDWIVKQPWSDGQVAMYGGSYDGFAQWAATKTLHPALKTIVPYVAAIPGQGLPMENNIFLNANYAWAFYVANNPGLDDDMYSDHARWSALSENWYKSDRAFKEIDAVDGIPNPWLQKWLKHPSYDAYWQEMVPYGEDYARINIPVLTVTGYYDDGQISALHYLKEHYRNNNNANHYLVIGPYDHKSAQKTQSETLRGLRLDPVAHINVPELTFEWIDHVLKGSEKPALLKDKINYQLMGDDSWRHAPSLDVLQTEKKRFFLGIGKDGAYHQLSTTKEAQIGALEQIVDLADRDTINNDYYPWPIIKDSVEVPNGFAYVSAPLEEDTALAGFMSGELKLMINKRDLDIGLVLYELLPDGRAVHLSYFLGRASYADDMSKRKLLTPGAVETVRFERSRMVAKRIDKGSRLLLLVNVNKNPHAQVNYGTGKDVSQEDIDDAVEALEVRWFNNSYIDLPLRPIR